MLGELPLPWETAQAAAVACQADVLRGPVLQLLLRDPAERLSLQRFCAVCENPFAGDAASPAGARGSTRGNRR